MPSPRSDQRLVQAARQGEQAALAELVRRHYGLLVASCRRMLGGEDAARDAAQETVVRAMLGLDRLRDESRFGPWLIGIGLNVCRGMLGARVADDRALRAAARDLESAARHADVAEPAELIAARELATDVRRAIEALPRGQRQAVALFYLAGLTHAEIASEAGTRPGAIKTRLHKARRSLRRSLLSTYQEYTDMPDAHDSFIPMSVAQLRRTPAQGAADERHIVFLRDDQQRELPIWIGSAEATAMAVILEDVELPRPGAYHFAAGLLAGAGGRLQEVRVTALTSSVFYAQAVLADGTEIDARPSDALTLALVCGVPIYVAASVLEQSDRNRAALSELLTEAEAADDDARVIADEVRARYAASAAELADWERRLG